MTQHPHQLPPHRAARIASAIVEHKASIGFGDQSDADVLAAAAIIHSALLVVCDGIARDLANGDPTAPLKRDALKWFLDACLDDAPAPLAN